MRAHFFLKNRALLVVTKGEGMIFFHVVVTGVRIRRGSEGKRGLKQRVMCITTKQGMSGWNHQK